MQVSGAATQQPPTTQLTLPLSSQAGLVDTIELDGGDKLIFPNFTQTVTKEMIAHFVETGWIWMDWFSM